MESLSFKKYILLSLFTLSSTICYGAEPTLQSIGQVVWVKNTLKAQQPNAESRVLSRRSSIFEHDTIVSDTNSSGEISFTDDSALSLQSNSTVKIDQYNHKNGGPAAQEAFVVDVIKGGFRTVTGAISKNNPGGYKTTSPIGTIGVMGTEYSVFYNPPKEEFAVKLEKGSIVLSNKNGEVTLTKCATGSNKKGVTVTTCVNKLFAEVHGTNSAPVIVSEQPAVFNSEPPVTTGGGSKNGGIVGSFCIS